MDLGGRRLRTAGTDRRPDDLTHTVLPAWLDHRRENWPHTANTHLLISQRTAVGLGPVGHPRAVRNLKGLLALCHSREQAEQVKERLAEWLAPRGLVFNETKSQITSLDRGVAFLGSGSTAYPNGKLLTKPSNDAVRRIRRRLSAEMRPCAGPTPTR